MVTSADDVEKAVIQVLQALVKRGSSMRRADATSAWTATILTNLGRLGRKRGYTAYTSKGNAANDTEAGEWLYDLTWVKYDRDRYIEAVPLVLESELGWDHGDCIDDFCKLVVARADHRVMIFWANDAAMAKRIMNDLIQEVEHSGLTRRGDRYLFAALRDDVWPIDFRCYRATRGSKASRAHPRRGRHSGSPAAGSRGVRTRPL